LRDGSVFPASAFPSQDVCQRILRDKWVMLMLREIVSEK